MIYLSHKIELLQEALTTSNNDENLNTQLESLMNEYNKEKQVLNEKIVNHIQEIELQKEKNQIISKELSEKQAEINKIQIMCEDLTTEKKEKDFAEIYGKLEGLNEAMESERLEKSTGYEDLLIRKQ